MSKKVNVEVHAKNREHPERLIKRFLNKVKKEKIIEEVRDRRYYESPSQKRARMKNRRKKVLAKLRKEREALDAPKERKE
jgi:ribosomal protein S21